MHAFRICDIVIRQFLAVQLFCGGEASFNRQRRFVKSGLLMRILAVTHLCCFFVREGQLFRQNSLSGLGKEIIGDQSVIGGSMFKDFFLPD